MGSIEKVEAAALALTEADFAVAETCARSQAEYRNPVNAAMERDVRARGEANLAALALVRQLQRQLQRQLIAAPGGEQKYAAAHAPRMRRTG